jgi:hypothetical protein
MNQSDQILESYLSLPQNERLEKANLLLDAATIFLTSSQTDIVLAKRIYSEIMFHRQLMGMSKKYEMATELDKALVTAALNLGRIAFRKDLKELVAILEAAEYYEQGDKKLTLKKEIETIKKNI